MNLTSNWGRPRAVSLTAAKPVPYVAPVTIQINFIRDLYILIYKLMKKIFFAVFTFIMFTGYIKLCT